MSLTEAEIEYIVAEWKDAFWKMKLMDVIRQQKITWVGDERIRNIEAMKIRFENRLKELKIGTVSASALDQPISAMTLKNKGIGEC